MSAAPPAGGARARRRSRRYLAGLAAILAAALGLGWALGPGVREGVWLAAALALVVQGPLGWWLVQTVGTPRLVPVWAVGMAARLLLLGAAALVVLPALGWEPTPALVALAALLTTMLLLEGAVLMLEPSQDEA